MKRKKQDYFLIFLALTLGIIVLVIAILAFSTKPAQQSIPATPTATPTPIETKTNPPVKYDQSAQDKLLDRVQHRRQLTNEDASTKTKILSLLPQGEQSGILFQSTNIIIDYTHSADIVQVEILITDIQQAKAEANIWFRSQGMSQQGICDLPVMFYLNFDVATKLRGSNVQFSPLPNSC